MPSDVPLYFQHRGSFTVVRPAAVLPEGWILFSFLNWHNALHNTMLLVSLFFAIYSILSRVQKRSVLGRPCKDATDLSSNKTSGSINLNSGGL